jgi:hypothetical protein
MTPWLGLGNRANSISTPSSQPSPVAGQVPAANLADSVFYLRNWKVRLTVVAQTGKEVPLYQLRWMAFRSHRSFPRTYAVRFSEQLHVNESAFNRATGAASTINSRDGKRLSSSVVKVKL